MSYRVVRASEISEYVYCRRAWWLNRTAGKQPRNTEQLEAGTSYHEKHGTNVRRFTVAQQFALVLLFCAVSTIVFWLFQFI